MEEEQKREDFASIEQRLNRSFENNAKISPEVKELARACFGRIFYMLGEKNFRRWINMKQFNKQIKEIVIESMSEEEVEKKPTTMGYYTRGKNRIRLSPLYSEETTKDTNVHETFHLITDTGDNFCTFLDEGLTEYMKGMAIGQPDSYLHNVRTVTFLHEVLGDSLIKAYLIGKGNFDEQFLNLINYDNSSSISDVEKFYSNLNLVHRYNSAVLERNAFARNGATPEIIERANNRLEDAKSKYDSGKPQILSMYTKIVVGRISEMAKNMQFYKKGDNGVELDLEEASKSILELMKKSNIQDFDIDIITMAEWRDQTSKLAAEQVLENSHILVGYEGDEHELRKQELINKIAPKIVVKPPRQTSESSPSIKNADILPEENSNMVSKLFENKLNDNMSITEYIETISQISKVTELPDAELENYLNKYNIEFFGDVGNFKRINEVIRSSIPKIQKLNELEQKRKKDTISSEYKSIGNGRFIEKRDNQIFFVELDEKGEFSEQEIKYPRESIWLKDRSKVEIDLKNGLSNLDVKINRIPVEIGKTIGLQDIKDMELAEAFSKDIEKNIRKGKYTRIFDDAENPWRTEGIAYTADIDKRSREVLFDQYISDLKSIIRIIPESQRNNIIKSKTEMLLDKTFRIPKERQPDGTMKRNEDIEYEYKRFSNAIINSVKNDSVGKIELGNIKRASEVLSNERKEMVEKNSKIAVIYFKDPNVQKRYEVNKRSEAIRNSNKALNEEPKNFDCSQFFEREGEIPLDEIPFHLKGVTTSQRIDSRNVKFLYNDFAKTTKGLLSKYPEKIHYLLFEKIFDKQMQETYLVSDETETKPEIIEALDNVRDALEDKIFNDIELDDKNINESLSILNNNRREKIKEDRKNVGVQFASKDAKDMFTTFTDLLELVKKSGIKTDEVTQMVKDIMSAQMEQDKKPAADVPNIDE